MKKHVSPRRRAFTLIEMLVVIGIIALLAALIFPVYSSVKRGAQATSCLNNMKQLALGFQQYTADNGNRYPFAGNYQIWAGAATTTPFAPSAAWNGGSGHWVTGGPIGADPKNYTDAEKGLALGVDPFTYETGKEAKPERGALFPYVKSTALYICPSVEDNEKKRLTYSMNCAVAGASVQRIRVPGELVILVDEGKTLNDGYFWAKDSTDSTDTLFSGHNGNGNLLFADGHVKSYPFKEMPLDNTGPATTPGTGLNIKSRTAPGAVRFHDLALGGTDGSNRGPSGGGTCG